MSRPRRAASTPAPRTTVPVSLGERSYDILIGPGLLDGAPELLAERMPRCRFAVVTDANVAPLHLDRLRSGLEVAGSHRASFVLPAGEGSKSFPQLAELSEKLLACGLERGDAVVALGGGVIGDLAGFAASILRRGVRLVQIPTTLLAQVDSSIGGKTGINTPQGKNLVGTFHQPSLVLADTGLLATLPARELRAGYAEVAKYGLLGDAGFFAWLEQAHADVLALEPRAILRAVETSCLAKAGIVARDETETGERALLNLGHTFGHALEAWAGYSGRLLHGEAVAIGMGLAFDLSETRGLCPSGSAGRVRAHLAAVGLPTRIADISGDARPTPEALIAAMQQDKKVKAGAPALVLVRDIGKAFVSRDATWEELAGFLARHC